MTNIQLPTEVGKKYELINWHGSHCQIFGTHGLVDLTKITLQQADRLVKNNFSKLALKTAKASKQKAETAKASEADK